MVRVDLFLLIINTSQMILNHQSLSTSICIYDGLSARVVKPVNSKLFGGGSKLTLSGHFTR